MFCLPIAFPFGDTSPRESHDTRRNAQGVGAGHRRPRVLRIPPHPPQTRAAARRADLAQIAADVEGGTRLLALKYALKANDAHGPRRTNADKRRACIAASAKPRCTILDFVGNSGRHKLVTSADILGGRDDDPLEEEARRQAKRRCEQADRAHDMAEELEKSREEIRREKAEAERRRNFVVASTKYTLYDVTPFNVFQVLPIEDRPGTARASVLSPKKRQILRERMKINPATISTVQGRQVIDEHFRRINRHLASYG